MNPTIREALRGHIPDVLLAPPERPTPLTDRLRAALDRAPDRDRDRAAAIVALTAQNPYALREIERALLDFAARTEKAGGDECARRHAETAEWMYPEREGPAGEPK